MSDEERRLELEKPWNPPENKADWTAEIWEQFDRRLQAKYQNSGAGDFAVKYYPAKPQPPEDWKEEDQ